tara:strand:- start:232 stop:870 length:639 start_codon:yes stop_codon:yes gene_type:complete
MMKGKKGMTLVIAVGKPSPKSPMDTANADKDEKKKGLAVRGFGRQEPTTLARIASEHGLPFTRTSGIYGGTEGKREYYDPANALDAQKLLVQTQKRNQQMNRLQNFNPEKPPFGPIEGERRRNLISLQPQGADMVQRSDDAFDTAWSLLKNYNQMGVPSEASAMTQLQEARQRVLELDAAAQAEQDPQKKMELQAMANSLYQELMQMMSTRR